MALASSPLHLRLATRQGSGFGVEQLLIRVSASGAIERVLTYVQEARKLSVCSSAVHGRFEDWEFGAVPGSPFFEVQTQAERQYAFVNMAVCQGDPASV